MQLNEALKRALFSLERSGSAANPRPLTQRNNAVFESHFNLFRESDPAIQELKAFCWDQLLSLVGQLNGYDLATIKRLEIYNDCWFHITRRGGFFGLHNHPNASWSGVYCVDPGRHDPDKSSSGVLSFVNPMLMSSMHVDAGNAKLQPPFGNQIASFRLAPGATGALSVLGAARREALRGRRRAHHRRFQLLVQIVKSRLKTHHAS